MVLVANRNAGGFDPRRLGQVRRLLERHGQVDVVETGRACELDEVLADLDGRDLAVAGGDGTIHHAVARLRHAGRAREQPVGVIPMGSGNDLLLGQGCSADALEVASSWGTSVARPFDALVGDAGQTVVNAVGLGIGVRASAWSRPFKHRLPGYMAYRIGALGAGLTTRSWNLRVLADGRPFAPADGRGVLSVVIANGSTFGGGTCAIPSARPDDGLMDVLVSRASGPISRMGYGLALRDGTHLDRGDVAHVRCEQVTVEGQAVGANVDGEIWQTPHRRRTFRVEHHAWKLRIPTG